MNKQKFEIPDYDGAGLYEIRNINNNRVYIGSCANIHRRGKTHISALRGNRHQNKGLQSDYNNGDSFTMSIVKKVHTTYSKELRAQEMREIRNRKINGQDLYNVAVISSAYTPYITKLYHIADLYCREHFGKTVDMCLVGNEATSEMKYQIIMNPERENELREEFAQVIDYKNKADVYRGTFGIDYDVYMSMPEDERPKLRVGIKAGK